MYVGRPVERKTAVTCTGWTDSCEIAFNERTRQRIFEREVSIKILRSLDQPERLRKTFPLRRIFLGSSSSTGEKNATLDSILTVSFKGRRNFAVKKRSPKRPTRFSFRRCDEVTRLVSPTVPSSNRTSITSSFSSWESFLEDESATCFRYDFKILLNGENYWKLCSDKLVNRRVRKNIET